jgi:hypothetical protein
MKMTKYYFKCPDCGRTLTELMPEGEKPLFFRSHCLSTIKCRWGGRLRPSEAFNTKTVNVKPGRKVSRKISE